MRAATRWSFGKRVLCALLCLFVLIRFGSFELHAAGRETKPKKKAELSGDFFNEATVRVFQIEIPEAALLHLRRSPRTYVAGQLREGEHVLTNVAIRLKGMGSFRSVNEKPSLAIKFDEFATNQTYRGLSKLMFNNSLSRNIVLVPRTRSPKPPLPPFCWPFRLR